MSARSREPALLLAAGFAAAMVSGVRPADPLTWVLEAAPAILAALILLLGAHYTYAEVPLGFWMRDAFGFACNHYDRIGHFAQGFVPAIVAREVLVRTSPVRSGRWLSFLVTCICLAASAFYEFTEWWAALLGGSAADAFLGTQGDPWDTQADMLMALLGALSAQLLLGRAHDRQIARLAAYTGASGGTR